MLWTWYYCRHLSLSLLSLDPFDSHDDRDDDPEGESVEEHKSVIMHLLSQVRLGMDLTKVKAPKKSAALWSGSVFSGFCVPLLFLIIVSLTAVLACLYTHYNFIFSVTNKSPVSQSCLRIVFAGGPAYLHPRKKIFVRDVRRLLCASRLICKVIYFFLYCFGFKDTHANVYTATAQKNKELSSFVWFPPALLSSRNLGSAWYKWWSGTFRLSMQGGKALWPRNPTTPSWEKSSIATGICQMKQRSQSHTQ